MHGHDFQTNTQLIKKLNLQKINKKYIKENIANKQHVKGFKITHIINTLEISCAIYIYFSFEMW